MCKLALSISFDGFHPGFNCFKERTTVSRFTTNARKVFRGFAQSSLFLKPPLFRCDCANSERRFVQ